MTLFEGEDHCVDVLGKIREVARVAVVHRGLGWFVSVVESSEPFGDGPDRPEETTSPDQRKEGDADDEDRDCDGDGSSVVGDGLADFGRFDLVHHGPIQSLELHRCDRHDDFSIEVRVHGDDTVVGSRQPGELPGVDPAQEECGGPGALDCYLLALARR